MLAPFYVPALSEEEIAMASTVSAVSAPTFDRMLAKYRSQATKLGLSTARPRSHINKHIPIKTSQWEES